MVVTSVDFVDIPIRIFLEVFEQAFDNYCPNVVFDYFTAIFGSPNYVILNLIDGVIEAANSHGYSISLRDMPACPRTHSCRDLLSKNSALLVRAGFRGKERIGSFSCQ